MKQSLASAAKRLRTASDRARQAAPTSNRPTPTQPTSNQPAEPVGRGPAPAPERHYDVAVVQVVRHGDRMFARSVDLFRAGAALAANAAFVLDALETAGVPHVVVEAEVQRRRRVAVSERHLDVVLAALAAAGSTRPICGSWVSDTGSTPSAEIAQLPARDGARNLRVFEMQAAPDGQVLAAADLACNLEFWAELERPAPTQRYGEPLEAGALVAPRPNRWVEFLHPNEVHDPATGEVDGRQRATLPLHGSPHQLEVTFPVDVVYTWVDGSDPAWLARKEQVRPAGDVPVHDFAAHGSRFASYDELRYSLRSLEMYADWVRRVYLVTDDQTPSWLDTAHPALQVVSHAELFGTRGVLPTFNSHAIESQLHRLPGLAEHYLYLNDDVFFGRPVRPDHFFHSNGLSKFFASNAKLGLGPAAPADMPGAAAAKNNRDLLLTTFGTVVTNKSRHVPHPQVRATVEELEQRFPKAFTDTAANRFRCETDYSIVPSLHHNYGYATGRAVPGTIAYGYLAISDPDAPATMQKWLRDRPFDVFCLNDEDSRDVDAQQQAELLSGFLSRYYPLPSSYEL